MSSLPSKVCVIGLDGLDLDVISPLLQADEMPTLAGLCRTGSWGRTRTVVPPISSAAWTSICSGVSPGYHGVLGFTRPRPGSYQQRVIQSSDVQAPHFWDYLGSAGLRTIVFNHPSIYPAIPIHGAFVTGLLTPREAAEWCYPPRLAAELESCGLGFERPPTVHRLRRASAEVALRMLEAHARHQVATAQHLLSVYPWDAALVIFGSSDLVQHAFFGRAASQANGQPLLFTPAGEIMRRHFMLLDRLVGDLLQLVAADAAILVVSDHGFAAKRRLFRLNRWLEQIGLLRRCAFGRQLRGANVWHRRSLGYSLRKAGLNFIDATLPQRLRRLEVPLPAVGRMIATRELSWAHTRAFADPGSLGTGIRINLQGREPEGVVAPADYEPLRDELLLRLRALQDPESRSPVVSQAWRREELYPGPYADFQPDIIVEYAEGIRALGDHTRARDLAFGWGLGQYLTDAPADEAAWHNGHGLVIAAGGGLRPCGQMDGLHVLDIAPTVLMLAGLRPPECMEGRVMPCVASGYAEQQTASAGVPQATQQLDLGQEDEEPVISRLRDLGYL